MKIVIPVTDHENFSFAECLVFLRRSDKECLHDVTGNSLRKVIVVNDIPVLTVITDAPEKKGVEVEIFADANVLTDTSYIKQYITHWLHLDADLNEFYNFATKDKVLSPLIQQYKGLRLIGIPELFEAITWSIIGQQINLSFAYTLKQRLIHAYGHGITSGSTVTTEGATSSGGSVAAEGAISSGVTITTENAISSGSTVTTNGAISSGGKIYYVYPQPATIASLEPADLIAMQFSRSKADYILSIAKAMAEERLSLAHLQSLGYAAAREYLISFKGIGNWSANYVLMKFSRYWQALPLEDAGLHNALKYQLQLPAKPSLAEIREYTQHWQQHAAYATFYLWRSLQQ